MAIGKLAIDQAADRHGAGGMVAAVMSIGLGQCVKTASETNRVFHRDAAASESTVEGHICGRTDFPAWFAAWGDRRPGRVEFVHADIGQIAERTDACGQAVEQLRLFE